MGLIIKIALGIVLATFILNYIGEIITLSLGVIAFIVGVLLLIGTVYFLGHNETALWIVVASTSVFITYIWNKRRLESKDELLQLERKIKNRRRLKYDVTEMEAELDRLTKIDIQKVRDGLKKKRFKNEAERRKYMGY
jgi:membrane protein implicated in regulation of membrane protease activity